MNFPPKKLGDLISLVGGGTPSKDKEEYWGLDIPWATVKDLKSHKLTATRDHITSAGLENSASKMVNAGSIIIATRMAVGRVAISELDVAINQDLKGINCSSKIDSKYLFYFLGSQENYFNRIASGATVKGIKIAHILDMRVPLPNLAEQQKIAAILDAADSLRQKDQQLIEHYTALSQSLFLEMFGDPVVNPKGFKSIQLENIANITSGVTKGRKIKAEEVFEIPYMRVANVQAGHLNLDEIKTVPGTKADIEKYGLQKGDVLLTEGGDPDKLGRGTVWNNEIKNCIHQNHIFSVRLTDAKITPLYLSRLCGSEYGKRYFLKSGKQTTGIASINKTQLKRFPVLCPSIELQNQFTQRTEAIEQQKQQAQTNLEKSEALFNSLLQRAFKGELTANSTSEA